ncbi:hypothetical protein OJ998_05035 [Solirubrobacter taibaiensis]|nr:hypothetical protein [Solirubrobacter taibaiensis]
MENISSDRLDEILSALSELLVAAGADAHLVVIGGSGLVAIGAVTRPTRDVDVVALKHDDQLVTAKPLPEPVATAAAIVARDFDLDPDWLNPGPTSLLDLGLPQGFQKRLITRRYGPSLAVSFAARVDQVFFKLYAAADRQEPRDVADLQALMPMAEELRAAARWTRTHNAPGPFDIALAQTLSDFGVEDEGRDGV